MKKPGEVFESRLTGCILRTVAAGSKGRCYNCAYSDLYMIGQDTMTCTLLKDLRREEAGNCSAKSRSDGTSVRFEIDRTLYEISEETKKLLVEVQQSGINSNEREAFYKTLLLAENTAHRNEDNEKN